MSQGNTASCGKGDAFLTVNQDYKDRKCEIFWNKSKWKRALNKSKAEKNKISMFPGK